MIVATTLPSPMRMAKRKSIFWRDLKAAQVSSSQLQRKSRPRGFVAGDTLASRQVHCQGES